MSQHRCNVALMRSDESESSNDGFASIEQEVDAMMIESNSIGLNVSDLEKAKEMESASESTNVIDLADTFFRTADTLFVECNFTNTTATWAAAIAAFFSAVTAVFAYFLQRKNIIDSNSPELDLGKWERRTEKINGREYDKLYFKNIVNIGRGDAISVYINIDDNRISNNFFTATFSTVHIPILASDGEFKVTHGVDQGITLAWKNVTNGSLHTPPITISIIYWDKHNYRHETIYSLLVLPVDAHPLIVGGNKVAHNVILLTRTSSKKSVRSLKFKSRLNRIFGRLYKIKPRI